MKYQDLFFRSEADFLRKLDADIEGLGARLSEIENVCDRLTKVFVHYEALGRQVEGKAFLCEPLQEWIWNARQELHTAKNLYSPEMDKSGSWYRWTGPNAKTEFKVLLDRSQSYEIELSVTGYCSDEAKRQLMLLIDGAKAPLHRKGKVLCAEVPRLTAPAFEPTAFTISSAVSVSPRDAGTGTDERQLGIAIAEIAIHKAAVREPIMRLRELEIDAEESE